MHGEHIEQFVAINECASGIHHQHPIAITIEGNTDICALFCHLSSQRIHRGGPDAIVNIESLGVISCGLVTIISADLLFEHRDTPILFRFRQAGRLIAYLFWLLWQVVLANYHILKLAMGSKDRVQPQFVRCKTSLKSDFEKYLLANSITLTPGTVTTKIIGDTFYIHAIDDVSAAGLEGEMERRIAHIFSTAPKSSTSGES